MKFELIPEAVIENGQKQDAFYISEYCQWIPVPLKGSEIEMIIEEGVRCIKIQGTVYRFHQARYEYGRPQLLRSVIHLVESINDQANG